MRRRLMVLLASVIVATAVPVLAQSGRLWSERSGTAPLAQVPNFRALAEQLVRIEPLVVLTLLRLPGLAFRAAWQK